MPPHKQIEALVRVAARYFRVFEDQLRAPGGRYLPLVQFRQVTQFVAYEAGHNYYQIAKAFNYAQPDGSIVRRNIAVTRKHIENQQQWWIDTIAALEHGWSHEVG